MFRAVIRNGTNIRNAANQLKVPVTPSLTLLLPPGRPVSIGALNTQAKIHRFLMSSCTPTLSRASRPILLHQSVHSFERKSVSSPPERLFARMLTSDAKDCQNKDEIYNYEVLDSLSAQLHSIGKAKLKFKKLNLTDDWSTIYTTNKNAYEIIQNEIDKELGEIAKEVIGKAGFISEIEEEGQLARLERSRHFTETFYEVSSAWIDRFREVFKSKKELSDEAIVVLFNVTNTIKKYYIQIHELEPPANEWSLSFPVKPITHPFYRK